MNYRRIGDFTDFLAISQYFLEGPRPLPMLLEAWFHVPKGSKSVHFRMNYTQVETLPEINFRRKKKERMNVLR